MTRGTGAPRRRLPRRQVVGRVFVALLVAGVGWLGWYRLTYHTFAWWVPPPEVSYRGWDYAFMNERLPALPTHGGREVPALRVEPGGWQFYQQVPAGDSVRDACPTTLYVARDSHEVDAYEILGGPCTH